MMSALASRCCVSALRGILHGAEESQLDTKHSIYDRKLVSNLRKELHCSDLFVYVRPGEKPQLWCQLSAAAEVRNVCCQMLWFRRSFLPEKPLYLLKLHHSNLGRHRKDLQDPDSLRYREALVVKEILQQMPTQLQGVPFLLRYEWQCHKGLGDLVFTDGHSLYVIVEVKHIHVNPTAKNKSKYRRQRRQKVEQQAIKYYSHFCNERPGAIVLAATFTNDRKLQWLKLDGQTADGITAVTGAAAHIASMKPRNELLTAHMNDADELEDQPEGGIMEQAADNSSSKTAAALVGGLIAVGLAVYFTPRRHRASLGVALGALAVLAAAPAKAEAGSRAETYLESRAVLKPKPPAGFAPRMPIAGNFLIFVLSLMVLVLLAI